jgi:hypothetical protein
MGGNLIFSEARTTEIEKIRGTDEHTKESACLYLSSGEFIQKQRFRKAWID